MMSDVESEVKWRMGRLYSERLELRDLIDDKQDLEAMKVELLYELDNIRNNKELLNEKKRLSDELEECKSNETLLKRKDKLTDLTNTRNKLIQELDKHMTNKVLLKRKIELTELKNNRDQLIQELNKHKNNSTILKKKNELIKSSEERNNLIQELNKHKNNETLLKRKDKLTTSLDVMKYNKALHTIEASNITLELKSIQEQLYPLTLTTKISDLDYVQTELKSIQEQLTPASLTTKISDLDYVQTELKSIQEQLTPASLTTKISDLDYVQTELKSIQEQLTPVETLNKLTTIQQEIDKTNHISAELKSIQNRLDMAQGTYRHVTIPGEYALEQQKICHGRDSYPREGFLFDFMINNNIDTQLIIGGERSFGFNGVLFSQARTIGDDQVILYPDHNLYPTPAVDFLLNKNFNQTIESVPFEDKPDIAVWRGGDTGGQGPVPGQVELGLDKVKINRQHFVNKFKNTKCIDAAIIDSDIGPSTPEIKGDPNWLMPHEQANNYKYIISLEGNDAGSNPRWVFSTQCVVFMSDKLTSELTWHYHLKPWVNYIPFKHDLSDLENKIKWANDNIDECKSIIKRANEMHGLVTDVEREYKILTLMFRRYKQNIKY